MHRAAAALGISYRCIASSLLNSKPYIHGLSNIVVRRAIYQIQCCRECGTLTYFRPSWFRISYGKRSSEWKSPSTKIMQMRIINALRLGDRSKACSLLQDYSCGEEPLNAYGLLDIFEYCVSRPNPEFVMETWRLMQEKKISLNDACCKLMVEALCNGGYLNEAAQLICFVEENNGFYKSLPVYNIFLNACVRDRSIYHASQCLDLMEHRMIGKNDITYAILLKLAVWQKNLSGVHEIWKDYIKHYSPALIPLLKFLESFTRLNDLSSAYSVLQHMVVLSRKRTEKIFRSSRREFEDSRLDIPILSMKGCETEKFFVEADEQIDYKENETNAHSTEKLDVCGMGDSHMLKQYKCHLATEKLDVCGTGDSHMLKQYKCHLALKILRLGFNQLIYVSTRNKDYELAEKLFLQMQNLQVQPSIFTYDGLIRARVFKGDVHSGLESLKLMQAKNLKPLDSTFCVLSIGCSRNLDLDRAEELLDKVSTNASPHPFNSFLAACDKMGQRRRASRMLDKMNQLNVQPDIVTYQILLLQLGEVIQYEHRTVQSQVHLAKMISALEMDMAKNGIQHSRVSMIKLLRALGVEGMIRELLQYFHIAEHLFCRDNTFHGTAIYNTVLDQLVKAGESRKAFEVFKKMKFDGIARDTGTYNIMLNCCSTIKSFRFALALVSMMIHDGLHAQTLTYTVLIKILLGYQSYGEALILLDQAMSEGYLDAVLYDTILKKTCEEGRIDVAEYVVEHMHQQKIRPNPEIIEHIFSAYVDCGYHATAVEALKVLSMRMLSGEDGALMEMMEQLEGLIFSEELKPESVIPQFLRNFEEERACALLNLRLCAIMGVPISWSTSGSHWAKRLTANYNMRKVAV